MRLISGTIIAGLYVSLSFASCSSVTFEKKIKAQTQMVETHFSENSSRSIRLNPDEGSLSELSKAEAERIHNAEYRYRLTCGQVTVLTDDLNSGQKVCHDLAPNHDIVITAA